MATLKNNNQLNRDLFQCLPCGFMDVLKSAIKEKNPVLMGV